MIIYEHIHVYSRGYFSILFISITNYIFRAYEESTKHIDVTFLILFCLIR